MKKSLKKRVYLRFGSPKLKRSKVVLYAKDLRHYEELLKEHRATDGRRAVEIKYAPEMFCTGE